MKKICVAVIVGLLVFNVCAMDSRKNEKYSLEPVKLGTPIFREQTIGASILAYDQYDFSPQTAGLFDKKSNVYACVEEIIAQAEAQKKERLHLLMIHQKKIKIAPMVQIIAERQCAYGLVDLSNMVGNLSKNKKRAYECCVFKDFHTKTNKRSKKK